MQDNTEIIELKFEGNNIKPSAVKASEVAELIKSFEFAIDAIVRNNHPEIKEDFVLVSFDEIKNESITIKCIAHKAKEYVLPAYITIVSAFSNNNFNELPYHSIENLRKITHFSKKYLCDGAFISKGERLANFSGDTDVSYNEANTVRGDTTLYGEVLRVGGENSRVQIKVNNTYTISFEVKREIAIYLATKLYKEVGLKGNARWDTKTYKVIDFRAEDIVEIEPSNLNDVFKDLNKLFGDHLNNTPYTA